MIKPLGWALVLVIGLACPVGVEAKGNGHGKGRHQAEAPPVKESVKRVGREAADAVADEILNEQGRVTIPDTRPPGLAKQNKMPPGLAKQGKTPPGWSKGQKTGWDKTDQPPKESLVRRMVRGIFKKQPTQPVPAPAPQQ